MGKDVDLNGPAGDLAAGAGEALGLELRRTMAMVRASVEACPPEMWDARLDGQAPFWQQAYHAISGVDFWLDDRRKPFSFPPFHSEAAGQMRPDGGPVLSRADVLAYLTDVDAKCERVLARLDAATLQETVELFGQRLSLLYRIVGQIRHVQHHVGAMHVWLRRQRGSAPDWL